MSRTLKLTIEYDGSAYHGWQAQTNASSVQVEIEQAIEQFCGEKVRITGSGRTDSGVHALGQVASFQINGDMAASRFLKGLNAFLPRDIRVIEAVEVDAGFNARFSARQRTYEYRLSRRPTAIHRNYCWECFYQLDVATLDLLASVIVGNHDFGAFARVQAQSGGHDKRCIVYQSEWVEQHDQLRYHISANRFLHGMVRTLVGTMIDVARGHMTIKAFDTAFRKSDRQLAGPAAPAKGLFLRQVTYE